MNKNALKSYAPRARRDFIAAVTARAAKFGVSAKKVEPIRIEGDFAIIGGTPFPRKVAEQRRLLEGRIGAHGFAQVMEAAAYTWFNRFAAIRYMEIHGYLDHGYRVLSHPAGKLMPEIVEQADHVDLPGLNRDKVVELKLDGRKDEDLYRMLLIAQCNALHAAMPFLFERIDDETELLLPDNLLHTDSLVRQIVAEIDENDWKEIEIIGWLYQFYIAERKDEVIGKVVKSEDIPAATQLFTPNWIVKYMVQNSLGAKWLATYPNSPIRAKMEYYIEPAEQVPEVDAHLAGITPTTLDPQKITLIDIACGSGHILVEAYDLFRAIYLDQGYTKRDAARAILKNNLYGVDIDDRAAQMAGFALIMRARADDRSVLCDPPKINVTSLTDSGGWDADAIVDAITPSRRIDLLPTEDLLPETLAQPVLVADASDRSARGAIRRIIELFDGAKTFGSLISVPSEVIESLPMLETLLARPVEGDLLRQPAQVESREKLALLVAQARVLGRQYDCAVANPPYLGMAAANTRLKQFIADNYREGKIDLYSCFIMRCRHISTNYFSMIVQHSWMFLSRFEELRDWFLESSTLGSLAHLGPRAFESISGEVVQSVAFASRSDRVPHYRAVFFDVTSGNHAEKQELLLKRSAQKFVLPQEIFLSIPRSIFVYWASNAAIEIFKASQTLEQLAKPRHGMATSDNERFLREWQEVSWERTNVCCPSRAASVESGAKWFPYNKGGGNKKWSGHKELLVNWENDGAEIIALASDLYGSASRQIQNTSFYFKEGITWSSLSSENIAMRSNGVGFLFDSKGNSMFFEESGDSPVFLALCNSTVAAHFMRMLAPTLDFNAGAVGKLPVTNNLNALRPQVRTIAEAAVRLACSDWDAYETSWDFGRLSLLHFVTPDLSLPATYSRLRANWQGMTLELQRLEEDNNRLFINAYGLAGELKPEVSLKEITLTCNPHYRYGGGLSDDDREARLRSDTMREMISYAIGCMMGRYSLAEPGLIYANAGNEGFDPSRYGPFPADDDGIVPITDEDWFDDDVANRFVEFLRLTWSPKTLTDNLKFVAESVGVKVGQTAMDTIRHYLSREFFKDHTKTYKKRPIYWLFSSGREKAFECLVYLHRYNAGTLSRMRMEYVVPLQGRMRGKIEQIDATIKDASSTAAQTKLRKELEKLKKKQAELVKFDEELRHFADQRIDLDLDDGVKVNYAKFGNLLSEVKKISGDSDE